ncbi:MAG: two pore domain potassium channel family protein [Deltaproteobacteria bacterium]|nr:two pore domain potassium channel family protein [Deltaproteobacteria bacterium]MBW2486935.1 two pore domain potassium channel family protein [Deltaproteobacteria bacterium]
MKSRFIYIILSIMLAILISPYIRDIGKAGHIFTTLLAAMIPLTSFYALIADRNRAIIILFLAAPFVVLDGMSMFFAHRYLMIAAISFGTILYFYIIVLLVKNLLSYRVVTANLIYCAISTYLMIGVMWSGIYIILEGIYPDSFSGISEAGDLLYFSFVILTTVGFGDITPQSIISKRLVVFEAATGCIYLAVIIAMIVGRYMSMQEKHEIKSEMNLKNKT